MTPVELETRSPELETRAKSVPRENRRGPQTLPLLLEVGCEEIPARFLPDAEKGLGERVQTALEEARLLPVPIVVPVREPALQTFSTPRRLVVYVPALLAQQPDKVDEILGPPVKVAVDAQGNYTRAAESFAQKNSARLEDLARTLTPKGEYLSLRKTTQGRSAREILPEILPGAILGLAFPKSMYWTEKSAPRFVRPIRWVLALWGEGKHAVTVDFQILGVLSGDFTFGHRSQGRKPSRVTSFKSYAKKLKHLHVDVDPNSRRGAVIQEAQALVERASLKIVQDDGLVDWIVNSTEWPHALLGSFDERFLHLPREILITVMRDHQKYFAVEQAGASDAPPGEPAKLSPHFVTVLNLDSDPKGLIRQGHERVLAARFRDAEFFWAADQKMSLDKRRDILERVTFQAELGSYGDKVRRMEAVAAGLCTKLESAGKFRPEDARAVQRAIGLCKCDLTTQMVQEFPELQGIVGGLYAQVQGESDIVCAAIYDHYLPLGAEGPSPRTTIGAIVSLSDKLHDVVGGFAVGQEPTGSRDPFALRRQANGIVKVILEFKLPIDLYALVIFIVDTLFSNEKAKQGGALAGTVYGFMTERLRYYLETVSKLRYDTVRAVLTTKLAATPLAALKCAEDLERIRASEDFGALAEAAKRIKNILWKSGTIVPGGPILDVNDLILQEPAEKELYQAFLWARTEVHGLVKGKEFYEAFQRIAALRPVVGRFFDDVLVMADDLTIRENRLRLLQNLDNLFSGIAHLSEIVVVTADVDASTSPG